MMNKLGYLITLGALAGHMLINNNAIAGSARNAQQQYQSHCAQCHGNDGDSVLPSAANFKRGEGLRQSNNSLFARIRNGNNGCPSFAVILTDQEILEIISHLRKLGR